MVIACFGQTRTASSHLARSSSGGSSWSTYRKSSSRTSNTSGATAHAQGIALAAIEVDNDSEAHDCTLLRSGARVTAAR